MSELIRHLKGSDDISEHVSKFEKKDREFWMICFDAIKQLNHVFLI